MVLPSNLHIELPFFLIEERKRKSLPVILFLLRTFLSETAVFVWAFRKKKESLRIHVAFLSRSFSLFCSSSLHTLGSQSN